MRMLSAVPRLSVQEVGLDWQCAGIAPIHATGASDLVLRNVNTGAFEVYDITNNQLTGAAPLGQVGPDWQLGGFAADFAARAVSILLSLYFRQVNMPRETAEKIVHEIIKAALGGEPPTPAGAALG